MKTIRLPKSLAELGLSAGGMTCRMLALLLLAVLLTAWILSEPILRWWDRFKGNFKKTARRRKTNKDNFGNVIGPHALSATLVPAMAICILTARAQATGSSADSASVATPLSESAINDIWPGSIGDGSKPETQSLGLRRGGQPGSQDFWRPGGSRSDSRRFFPQLDGGFAGRLWPLVRRHTGHAFTQSGLKSWGGAFTLTRYF